tara:strand:- start:518 stop:1807 length:1290 start_codon:yes stop_codon:yes gene_type:complete
MQTASNLRNSSFLVYGLGTTGKSVIRFFKKNKINNFKVWDDKKKKLFKNKRPLNLISELKKVNFIVLSPGISINNSKYKRQLYEFRDKIITDIDLVFLTKKKFKSIVVTGTNGKSTTCKLIEHILKKNNYKTFLGGNIGTPILDLKLKANNYLIIEASSFQLAYSKFICPDYAVLLNITNDHLDWHGNKKNYINAKLGIFKLQKKNHYSLINIKLKKIFKQKKFLGKLITPNMKNYLRIKLNIRNEYLNSNINDENVSNAFELSKLLNINQNAFIKSVNTFRGLPHRCEIFLKKRNITFINDSKATSFQATKFALKSLKNIYWIVGGLPKKKDRIILKNLKKNIIKSYIIGKKINFFKKQIEKQICYYPSLTIRASLLKIFKDIKILKDKEKINILLSPAAASFDQYSNFEKRGNEYKKLVKFYAKKYL